MAVHPRALLLYLQQGLARLWRVANFTLGDFLHLQLHKAVRATRVVGGDTHRCVGGVGGGRGNGGGTPVRVGGGTHTGEGGGRGTQVGGRRWGERERGREGTY